MEGLNVRTVLGADINDSKAYYYQGVLADGQQRFNQTDLDQTTLQRTSVLSETTLNYSKVIGKNDLSAVVGMEFQNFHIKGTSLAGTNVPYNQPLNYSYLSPADITTNLRDETISRRSVFGRINYAYDNRYLASVSVRRDGDSRFGENNRYEVFPAVSVGWNVHNEAFYKSDIADWVKTTIQHRYFRNNFFLRSLRCIEPFRC